MTVLKIEINFRYFSGVIFFDMFKSPVLVVHKNIRTFINNFFQARSYQFE